MVQLFPRKNPEAAKELVETPDEKLANIEQDKSSCSPSPRRRCRAR